MVVDIILIGSIFFKIKEEYYGSKKSTGKESVK